MRASLTAATLLMALVLPAAPAAAYDGSATHAGLTAEGVLSSRLHIFLRRELALDLGLLGRLELSQQAMIPRRHRQLTRLLGRLDPAGGCRPDATGGLRALSWVMAGSVLADMPSSINRHHFYSPALRTGLNEPRALLGWLLSVTAMLEGGDTVREFFTATGFDLTGDPAVKWISSPHNPRSVGRFYDHLAGAVSEQDPGLRRHRLALAMLAMGDLLHVLQDMGSPSHVRNDFVGGHLQRLGQSFLNRGSAYERYVAQVYGQHGMPRYRGPAITRQRLDHFLSAPDGKGLADLTSVAHFSPGTLPGKVQLLRDTDPTELAARLTKRLPLAQPALGALNLACAARRTCYIKGAHGPVAAYRMDARRRLHFFQDHKVLRASARWLLPRVVGFSTGMVNHLLRGKVTLARQGKQLTLTNVGAPLASAQVKLLAEDGNGRRVLLATPQVKLPAAKGAQLAQLSVEPPAGTAALVLLVQGLDQHQQPLLATARVVLPSAQSQPSSQPATQPTTQPAPATQPATQPTTQPVPLPQPKVERLPDSMPIKVRDIP